MHSLTIILFYFICRYLQYIPELYNIKNNVLNKVTLLQPTIRTIISIFTLFVSLFCSQIQAQTEVSYHIDLLSAEHQLAQITVQLPLITEPELTINLPVWRTGKYQVLPLADSIRMLSAVDQQGESLVINRVNSGEWQVVLPSPTAVTLHYQLHAADLGKRVTHIDNSHAFLDASGSLLYSPRFRDSSIMVELNVKEGWQSYSGMKTGKKPHTFIAPNYDVLVDSPIETGINQYRSFEVDGVDYELVIWGEGNYNIDKIVGDLTRLAEQANVIWSDTPFKRYLYMLHATSGAKGATEHLNSTIIQRPRFSFRERQGYLGFIKTASHEFIHTWNVKSYRPQGLVPYDYQQENISELLWVAEGSTSYFQSQLLLRAGVITYQEFFEDLAKRIAKNRVTPGREIQSVAQASLNKWVAQGGDYGNNNSSNIYSEGFLTSWALDFSLLEQSELEYSYRDVHQRLYQQFRLPKGYSVDDFKNILQTLTGQSYQDWWDEYVNSPITLPFETLLQKAGLKLDYGAKDRLVAYTGFTFADNSLVVMQVRRGSPAYVAGFISGDELVAINGFKVTPSGFNSRINDFNVGDSIELTLFSNDKLIKKEMILAEQHSGKLSIKPVADVTEKQKAFFTAWLGIDWPFAQ